MLWGSACRGSVFGVGPYGAMLRRVSSARQRRGVTWRYDYVKRRSADCCQVVPSVRVGRATTE